MAHTNLGKFLDFLIIFIKKILFYHCIVEFPDPNQTPVDIIAEVD